jgi:hypothetical protein
MMVDRVTAILWWRHFDLVAHKLEFDSTTRPGLERRTPANPRHTADILKGEAMLCASDVDKLCVTFAETRTWPNDLSGELLADIQHRLGCAKMALEFMVTRAEHETAIALHYYAPDPLDAPRYIEFLLIPVWRLLSDIYLDEQARQLMALLSPEQLDHLIATNPPLQG